MKTRGLESPSTYVASASRALLPSEDRREAAASGPSYARMDKMRAEMLKMHRNTGDDAGVLAQDPFKVIKSIYTNSAWGNYGKKDFDAATALSSAYLLFFLDGLTDVAARDMLSKRATEVADNFEHLYLLDSAENKLTESLNAPILRMARVFDDRTRGLIDWNNRVVVKEYPKVDTFFNTAKKGRAAAAKIAPADISTVADMATDIILGGTVINQFVTHFRNVVTPHFAYQADWFLGPSIQSGATGIEKDVFKGLLVKLDTSHLSQYVIVEQVDATLSDFVNMLDSGSSRKTSSQIKPTLFNMRVILAQVLFSLDAAWQTRRFVHYDTHTGNHMIRGLQREPSTPYANKDLVYSREATSASQPTRYLHIPAAQHENLFTETIDFGRSRAYVPLSNSADEKTLVLFGDACFTEYGIHADPARVDHSWDIRRLAINLLEDLDVDVLKARTITRLGTPNGEAGVMADNLKQWLVNASNFGHAILFIATGLDESIANAQMSAKDKKTVTAELALVVAVCRKFLEDGKLVDTRKRNIQTFAEVRRDAPFVIKEKALVDFVYTQIVQALVSLSDNSVIKYNGESTSVKSFIWFDCLFMAMFSDYDKPESARSAYITAERFLYDMPFFASLITNTDPMDRSEAAETALRVGIVHREDILTEAQAKNPVIQLAASAGSAQGKNAQSPGLNKAGKQAESATTVRKVRASSRLSNRGKPAEAEYTVSPTRSLCYNCNEPATGALRHANGDIVSPLHVFCSGRCANLYI